MKKPEDGRLFELNARQATLAFLLVSAHRHLFPETDLVVEHSFADGYFCHRDHWQPIPDNHIRELEKTMRAWLEGPNPLESTHLRRDRLISYFQDHGHYKKVAILRRWKADPVPVIRFGDFLDYRFEPMCTRKEFLINFQLMSYDHGMLLRFPSLLNPGKISAFRDHPHLFEIVEEYEQWGSILKVESIPLLNEQIRKKNIRELVWVAEGLHEKKVSRIADALGRDFPTRRVVFIAGPSASGKTTFAKRLSIQLRVNGFTTKHLSLDDYFIDREDIPRDENGLQDFERIEVLNLPLLFDRLKRLLNGQTVPVRRFDFNTGMGSDTEDSIQLSHRDFIIIEGIHGLNPALTQNVAGGDVARIYVSAITQLNIDSHHRFSTSDNRLLRRMVRDHKFRGYTPEDTLSRWPSVRMGEEKNIFPYQEQADFFFNSALIYELPVLAGDALPLLNRVKPGYELYPQIERLRRLLTFFIPLEEDLVPGTSILREFIGNSQFKY